MGIQRALSGWRGLRFAPWGDHPAFVDATLSSLYKGHRFPVEIISYFVWLYHRFPLSLRGTVALSDRLTGTGPAGGVEARLQALNVRFVTVLGRR